MELLSERLEKYRDCEGYTQLCNVYSKNLGLLKKVGVILSPKKRFLNPLGIDIGFPYLEYRSETDLLSPTITVDEFEPETGNILFGGSVLDFKDKAGTDEDKDLLAKDYLKKVGGLNFSRNL